MVGAIADGAFTPEVLILGGLTAGVVTLPELAAGGATVAPLTDGGVAVWAPAVPATATRARAISVDFMKEPPLSVGVPR
jgi:hypothetical protein